MAQHGDELFAYLGHLQCVRQTGLRSREAVRGIEMVSDQFGQEREHGDRFGRIEAGRAAVDGAQRAKKRIVGQYDGNRNIALDPEHFRHRIGGVTLIIGGVFDNKLPAALFHIAAEGIVERQFGAWRQSEGDFIAHRAGDPAILGHPCHAGEARAGHAAGDLQNLGNDTDTIDERDICICVQGFARLFLSGDIVAADRAAEGLNPQHI